MQPEPTATSPDTHSQQEPLESPPSSQHGLAHDQYHTRQPARPLDGERQPTSDQSRDNTAPPAAATRALDAVARGDARVSPSATSPSPSPPPSQTPSPAPRNRIQDYENALKHSVKQRSPGPIFRVINKDRKPQDTSSPVAKLPNEILVHAIAHLSPNDLAAVSLVSRRFNELVTTPHAWQVAFARYFPGPLSLTDPACRLAAEDDGDAVRSERRSFTRLTALASWRSEYILRTRLLRSLTRGKPVQPPSTPSTARSGQPPAALPIIRYPAQTFAIVNHLHATFGTGLNKRLPRFVHGSDDVGLVTSSDPAVGKVDSWGLSDPTFYSQFSERFPGVAEWGLGSGEVVGRPNVMDVSQTQGFIYGQGSPEGSCYYRAIDEMRGRFIAEPTELSMPEVGIPKLGIESGAVCSVWISKSKTIPSLSEGVIGMMMGSAAGVVSACSLGTDGMKAHRLQRGELTARWILSPGVPIIAIVVDENYSIKRQAQNRIWAVALNALGEIFYLTKLPTRSHVAKGATEDHTEYSAWLTGRSVYWNVVEPSRRTARPDPYQDSEIDGSYSPRSSWDGMCLSKEQIVAETREIQQYLRKQPKEFRKMCLGWDMQRRLEVDFANDDGNYGGEAMVVFECGLEEGEVAEIKRFTRWKVREKESKEIKPTGPTIPTQSSSIFGGPMGTISEIPDLNATRDIFRDSFPVHRARSSSYVSTSSSPERTCLVEEWRCSKLSYGDLRGVAISSTALDNSTFATLTMSEDPALGFSTTSSASSPYASPMSMTSQPSSPADVPGQRARFVAAGTKHGVVLVWDCRSSVSRNAEFINTIEPLRIIYTDSPEISCLALTALFLVHGGNDGLVQAWDTLASSMQPVRTLHSRFSSRARRRLVQAQASAQGVGVNMFAAGAICLDSDPTVLRGAVSLGNLIQYWSFSSSAADQYKSSKRRLRRSERGSNNTVERFSATGRVNLKNYIAHEKDELEREKQERRKHADHMAGRFGVDLLGNEDEALAYAALLSQETLEMEEKRRLESASATASTSALSSATITPEPSVYDHSSSPPGHAHDELDADMAEAIRLSLEEAGNIASSSSSPPASEIPIRYVKTPKSGAGSSKQPVTTSSSQERELSDLEFALQLSLAEEESRKQSEDEFPPLSPTPASGKGKGRIM